TAGSFGGGIDNDNGGTATLSGNVVAGNWSLFGSVPSPDDIGSFNAGGNDVGPASSDNLFGAGGSGGLTDGVNGNQVGVALADIGLAPLGDYGGQTQTFALLPGSRAIGL